MTSLLFALVFWWAVGAAAFGALILGLFVWFLIDDFLHGPSVHPVVGQRVPPRTRRPPSCGPPRPFDPSDPLEQALRLESAPDPTWLV